MAAPRLKLKLHFSDDSWTLTAVAASDAFSANGRAWIEPKELLKFADSLDVFPVDVAHPPELSAGKARDGKPLEAGYDFIRITIRPITAKGLLLAQIDLGEVTSDPARADRHPNSWDRIRNSLMDHPGPYFPYYQATGVAFPITYQSIADFGSALRSLVSGNAEDATLDAAAAAVL
jgi:hypothetical protein